MKKRTAIAMQFVPPVALTLYSFASSLQREPLGPELVAVQVLGTGLFFCAPYLLWLSVAAGLGAKGTLWHLGFVLSSVALGAIAVSPVFGRDSSGLPYHWLLYWPAACALLAPVALAAYLRRPRHAA